MLMQIYEHLKLIERFLVGLDLKWTYYFNNGNIKLAVSQDNQLISCMLSQIQEK